MAGTPDRVATLEQRVAAHDATLKQFAELFVKVIDALVGGYNRMPDEVVGTLLDGREELK